MSEEVSAPADADPEAIKDVVNSDCNGQVIVVDRGNSQYAHLNVQNRSENTASVTVERSWLYQGRRRTDTRSFTVPGNGRVEAFSFPRNQSPQITIVSCNLG